jgi:rhodanese-related sulfurtransferase
MKALQAAVAVSMLVAGAALACDGEKQASAVKSLTVPEVAELQKTNKATLVDANGSEFRAKNGVIPGAVLLTSAVKYEPAKELPSDKARKLVFYCASTKCGASHEAAEKAITAGYVDVNVLPDGLMGWKGAGQPTRVPQS